MAGPAAPQGKGKAPAHGADGGQEKTGKIPLSTHSHHEGTGKADGQFPTPPPLQVKFFHKFADTDSGDVALHHTLGPGDGQAAPGTHKHDGGDSPFLFDGFTVSGTRGTAAYYQSLEAALQAVGLNVTATGP
jgi:hypothetical protein